IVALQHRGHSLAVLRLGEHVGVVFRLDAVGMDEVKVGTIGNAVEHRVLAQAVDVVPAHMRNLETWPTNQSAHAAGDHIKTGMRAAFFGDGHQRLQAHADAEKRPTGGDIVADWLDQTALTQIAHRIGGRAHTGHDQRVGGVDVLGSMRHERLCAGLLDRASYARQIARTVVHDDNAHRCTSAEVYHALPYARSYADSARCAHALPVPLSYPLPYAGRG